MPYPESPLQTTPVDSSFFAMLVEQHVASALPRLRRLWDYYRNGMRVRGGSSADWHRYDLAQCQGLPDRLIDPSDGRNHRREVVIENDIAWRIHTLTDFMFGKPIVIQSLADDPVKRQRIEELLNAVFEVNGGVGFFHDLSLLGAVYGFVDVLLRVDGSSKLNRLRAPRDVGDTLDLSAEKHRLMMTARHFALETIEAPRVVPVIDPDDYRKLDAYALHFRRSVNRVERASLLEQLRLRVLGSSQSVGRPATIERTQLWTDEVALTFEGDGQKNVLIDEQPNTLGRIPVIHIQNLSQPFFYEGLSEVEPLIPLQDELNTRLSDRANRVTFQSFKMYLGKGIEKFTERPVGPGQMWSTDNTDASIEAFGGDADSPSEDNHINEIREAMDKISGVTAVAAGLLRNKVGNLTSENALRIVMMGLLAKTDKRRVTYGAGVRSLCELILHAADAAGVLHTAPEERGTRIDWPNPLPADESQHLRDAKVKVEIGVPREQVLAELGYADAVMP